MDVQVFPTSDYLDLVAWSGSVPKVGKASMPTAPDRVLRHLGCSLLDWQEQLVAMRTAGRAVGGTERMRALAERLKQCWVQRGRRMRQTGQG